MSSLYAHLSILSMLANCLVISLGIAALRLIQEFSLTYNWVNFCIYFSNILSATNSTDTGLGSYSPTVYLQS